MARRVALFVNTTKPNVNDAVDRLRPLIERHGELVGVCDEDTEEAPCTDADLVVVLGGDGTLLTAAKLFGRQPLLGVNFGKLGFMAAFDLETVEQRAASLFGTEALPLSEASMVEASVNGEPAGAMLNEFVISAGPPYRLIELKTTIDGTPGPTVRGDGLILATPLGSTAYNVAAGGPIVAPTVPAMILTPIAAHSLSFRPIVLPGSSTVEITVVRGNDDEDSEHGTSLVGDGAPLRRLDEGDVVRLGHAASGVRLVTNNARPYWSTLMTKMRWATAPGE